jgi:hypothetical protein
MSKYTWKNGSLKRLKAEAKNPFRDKRCSFGMESWDMLPVGTLWREVWAGITRESTGEVVESLYHIEFLRPGKRQTISSPTGTPKNDTLFVALTQASEPVDEATLKFTEALPWYTPDERDLVKGLIKRGIVSEAQVVALIKELDADLPEELQGASPTLVEDRLIELGWDVIDCLKDEE